MGLKLSQIIGVDMRRQILITNVWLEQVSNSCGYFIKDSKLKLSFFVGMGRLQVKVEPRRLWKC